MLSWSCECAKLHPEPKYPFDVPFCPTISKNNDVKKMQNSSATSFNPGGQASLVPSYTVTKV